MNQIADVLHEMGFKTCHIASARSVADLLPEKRRCGIYVLHFDDNKYYVGQSVNVFRRYLEHCRIYPNVVSLSFKRTRKDKNDLDTEEINTIRSLEYQKFRLLNIVHASISYRSSDFDLLMPLEEQQRWLKDLNFIDSGGERVVDNVLREKHESRYKYQESQGWPYTDQIIPVLSAYIRFCIPRFKQSEASLWNCSYLPTSPQRNVYARVNINWQAVFSAYMGTRKSFFDFWLTLSPFNELSEVELDKFGEEFEGVEIGDEKHNMMPGGDDQVYVIIRDPETALRFIQNPVALRAIRLFNLNLMKKGAGPYNRFHCFSLMDQAIDV